MEFLPVQIDGSNVYAGFFRRTLSVVIDFLIFFPLFFFFRYAEGVEIHDVIFIILLTALIFPIYSVVFHYFFGATIGKLITRIKVTKPDGTKIVFRQALLRSSVDIVLFSIMAVAEILAIFEAGTEKYFYATYLGRDALIQPYLPIWLGTVKLSSQIWHWSELVVMLTNKRMRALHDFLAGTVVIYKKYA